MQTSQPLLDEIEINLLATLEQIHELESTVLKAIDKIQAQKEKELPQN